MMGKPVKFSEALVTLSVGKSMTTEAPIKLDREKLKMKLVERNDKGLVTLNVSFMGVKMGVLRGKPGELSGYRFSDN